MELAWQPRLVEEAVFAALRGRREERAFHRERERAYRTPDPEERERRFDRLHLDWFYLLGLGEPVQQAIAEQRNGLAGIGRLLLTTALRDRDEAAELYVASGDRSVVIGISPGRLVDAERTLSLLRRELTHVADMLDPAFSYEPRLPPQPAGPAQDRLLQDRYRALWNCSVDGRLLARGWLPAGARDERLLEFARAFPGLGAAAEACFESIFRSPRPTHPKLAEMARDPARAFGVEGLRDEPPARCPLCGFPARDFEPDAGTLPAAVLEAISADFPDWVPAHRICLQCADLYRALPMSQAAASLLPGSA